MDLHEDVASALEQHTEEPVEVVSGEQETEPPAQPESQGRDRDERGRFASKKDEELTTEEVVAKAFKASQEEKQEAPEKSDATPAAAVQATPETPPEVQIPPILMASMRPAAREHWASLPPQVQQEIVRREEQVQHILQESAGSRQFASRFNQMIQPYQAAIQVETGGDVMKAVQGLMDTATRLRFGTPAEKAQLVANLVKSYGVDVMALDGALAGVPIPQGSPQGMDPNYVNQAVQQALAPIMQAAEQNRRNQEQAIVNEVSTELSQFAQKAEFFQDVRMIMADMMEISERNGIPMTLQDAYDRSCMLHPEIKDIMLARRQAATAQTLTKNAQRSRSAAMSVRGAAPVGRPDAEPETTEDAVRAAMEAHTRV